LANAGRSFSASASSKWPEPVKIRTTMVMPGVLGTVGTDETTPGDETKGGVGGPSCAAALRRPTEPKAKQKTKIKVTFSKIMRITNIIGQFCESESSFGDFFPRTRNTGVRSQESKTEVTGVAGVQELQNGKFSHLQAMLYNNLLKSFGYKFGIRLGRRSLFSVIAESSSSSSSFSSSAVFREVRAKLPQLVLSHPR
jgi:hypothetical protein